MNPGQFVIHPYLSRPEQMTVHVARARAEVASRLGVPVDEVDVEVIQVAGETRVRAYWLPT